MKSLSTFVLLLALDAAGQSLPTNYPVIPFSTVPLQSVASNQDALVLYHWTGSNYISRRMPITGLTNLYLGASNNTIIGASFSGGDFSGAALRQKNQLNFLTNMIACWGDSITAGGNLTTTNWVLSYPFYLNALGGYTTTNFGRSGFTSSGVAGVFAANPSFWTCPAIIECGVNDHTQGESDSAWTNACLSNWLFIARSLQSVGNSNYIFVSIINGTNEPIGSAVYTSIANFNSMAKATVGANHYFDIQAWMISNYNPQAPQDVIDVGNGVTPWSLRQGAQPRLQSFPWVHFNPFGQQVLARGLCGTMLNNWAQSPVTESTLRQNLSLWEMNSPSLNNPNVFGNLNFIDKALGQDSFITLSNREFSFINPDLGLSLFNIDYNPYGAQQVYFNVAPGWTGGLGYTTGIGPTPWIVFGTNSVFYGSTTLPLVQGPMVVSNFSGPFADGISSLAPALTPGAGVWWDPFLFGVKNAANDAVGLTFYYVADGSSANFWSPTWFGQSPNKFFYANGNESSTGNTTNQMFIGDGSQVTNVARSNLAGFDRYRLTGINDGLLAWYPFSDGTTGGTNVTDYTLNGNDGYITTNSLIWTNSAHFGFGLLARTNSFFELKASQRANFAQPTFTYSVWINLAGTVNAQVFGSFDQSGGAFTSPDAWGVGVGNWGSGAGLQFKLNNGTSTVDVTGTAPSTGAWHMVTATYDGSTMALYLDGSFSASSANANWVTNNAANLIPFTIGSSSNFQNPTFGQLDDAKFWNRALSAAEVTALFKGIGP